MTKAARQEAEARGRWAELIAAIFLSLKGYRILDRRFVASGGEIDLVTKKAGTLAFVEVKLRPSTEEARLAVTAQNQRRIKAASAAWLARKARSLDVPMRYDIVAVSPRGIAHHRDAFR